MAPSGVYHSIGYLEASFMLTKLLFVAAMPAAEADDAQWSTLNPSSMQTCSVYASRRSTSIMQHYSTAEQTGTWTGVSAPTSSLMCGTSTALPRPMAGPITHALSALCPFASGTSPLAAVWHGSSPNGCAWVTAKMSRTIAGNVIAAAGHNLQDNITLDISAGHAIQAGVRIPAVCCFKQRLS